MNDRFDATRDAEVALLHALLAGDLDHVASRLHAELLETSLGRTWTRDEILAELRSGNRPAPAQLEGWTFRDLGPELGVVAYRRRADDGTRAELCTSVWDLSARPAQLRVYQSGVGAGSPERRP